MRIVSPRLAHTQLFDRFRLNLIVQAHTEVALMYVVPVPVRQSQRYHKMTQR